MIKIYETELDGVLIIEPRVFGDERGYFFESFSEKDLAGVLPGVRFVQDNESRSQQGVVRGLHYQLPPSAQAKLVRAVTGTILDVAVDIRRWSPTFGRHVAVELSGENHLQLFVPRGFAHGFSVLSTSATVNYKCDNYYDPAAEGGILFDDPQLGIDWRLGGREAIVSEKDRVRKGFGEVELFDHKDDR